MNRWMLGTIAGLLAVSSAATPDKAAAPAKPPAGKTASSAPEEASPRQPQKLAEGVWAMMTKGGANAGWFTFGDSVIAVDAGRSSEDAEEILAEIRRTTGKKSVSHLILTNDFGPHAGGREVFVRAGATLVTHESFVGGLQKVAAGGSSAKTTGAILGITTRLLLARPERHVIVRHLGPADRDRKSVV